VHVFSVSRSKGPGEGVAAASPEDDFLLSAARAYFLGGTDPAARLAVSGALDWSLIGEKAEAHGLLPLLMRQIEGGCPDAFPAAGLESLRRRFSGHELRMLLMARELIRLLDLLDARGLRAIPFKGPALAAFLYGDPAMRRSDDLDLLIREQDFWGVSEALESQGFLRHPPITRRQMAAYSRSECDMTFAHGASGLRVEVHWALVPPYHGQRIPAAQLWERLETAQFLDRTIPMLSAEDHLTALCLHAAKHMWRRLEWICGVVALLVRARPPDLELAFRRARSWGSERVLLLGLQLARELTGMTLPAQAPSRIQCTQSVEAVAREVWSGLFREATPGFVELTRFRLKLSDRLSDRIRYCVNRALLPSYEDLGCVQLPGPLSYLYFLVRPARLTFAWARGTFTRRGGRLVSGPAHPARKGSC